MLDPLDVYSLLGLTAFYNGFFGQCSKAFTRLESLTSIDQVKHVYHTLSSTVLTLYFTAHQLLM